MLVDFLVIGAGVVGLAAAYHLKRLEPGARVLVLERASRPCMGNSGRSAALYRNLFLSGVSRDLAESSIAQYEEIAGAIALKDIGYLWHFDESVWKRLGDGAARLARLAGGTELLTGDGLRRASAMAPTGGYPPAAGAVLGRRCGALSAQALASWYAERFVELGGRIETGARVAGFELEAARAPELPARAESAVLADGRRFAAGAFVAAAGCWLQDLLGPLGVASAVYPKKRQLFAFELDEPALIYGEEEAGRPATILPYGGVYLKPVLERGLMVAGRADDFGRPFELPYAPVEPGAGRPEAEEDYFRTAVEPIVRAYFPALARRYPEGLALKQAWAGHYDYHLPDKNPVLERAANLWWIGGSSGSGIMKGDALGRATAAAALGRGEVELADGRRFKPATLSLRERSVDAEGMVI